MNKKSNDSVDNRIEVKLWLIKIESLEPLVINSEFTRQGSAKESLDVALV